MNIRGTGVCPTCGSGIKNTGINSLATAIEKRREAQKQLGVVIKAIQAAEGEVKKLQEENDFKLTEMVSVVEAQTPQIPTMNTKIPAIVPIGKFVLSDDSLFILKIFQSGQLKGEIQINPHISPATKHFLKLLGQFCYKSPKNFNSTIDKVRSFLKQKFSIKGDFKIVIFNTIGYTRMFCFNVDGEPTISAYHN